MLFFISFFIELGIRKAILMVLTVAGFVSSRSVVVQSKRLNSQIEIVGRTSGPDHIDLLKNLGVSEIVLPEFEASLEMTRQALLRLRVPAEKVHRHTDMVRQELYAYLFDHNNDYRFLSQLRGAEQQFELQWVRLVAESPIVHRSIGNSEIRKKTGASVVGVVRDGQLQPNPDANFVLLPHDLIAIIGSESDREAFCLMSAVIS